MRRHSSHVTAVHENMRRRGHAKSILASRDCWHPALIIIRHLYSLRKTKLFFLITNKRINKIESFPIFSEFRWCIFMNQTDRWLDQSYSFSFCVLDVCAQDEKETRYDCIAGSPVVAGGEDGIVQHLRKARHQKDWWSWNLGWGGVIRSWRWRSTWIHRFRRLWIAESAIARFNEGYLSGFGWMTFGHVSQFGWTTPVRKDLTSPCCSFYRQTLDTLSHESHSLFK